MIKKGIVGIEWAWTTLVSSECQRTNHPKYLLKMKINLRNAKESWKKTKRLY